MNKIGIFVSAVILAFFFASSGISQESEKDDIPPGMEVVRVGSARLIVPEGTKVNRVADIITLESTSQYVARRFLEMEERLSGIEEKWEKLEKELEDIKKILSEIVIEEGRQI